MDTDPQIRAMDPMSSGNWPVPARIKGAPDQRRWTQMKRFERCTPCPAGMRILIKGAGYPAPILENNLTHGGRSWRAVAFGYRDSSRGPSLRTYTRCQRSAGAHTRRRASRPIAGLKSYGTQWEHFVKSQGRAARAPAERSIEHN